MEENKDLEKRAGCIGIALSFIFPIVGIILYFVRKKSMANAYAYLYAAILAILLNILLLFVSAMMQR